MKLSSRNEIRNNKLSVLKKNNSTIRESKIQINEAKADESLAAEEVIAILLSNQNLTDSEIRESIKNGSNGFDFIVKFFTSISKTPIKDMDEIVSTTINAIANVRSFGFPSKASQFGTHKESPTSIWVNKYHGESSPIMPKTDVLNNPKHHSVKQRGKVQVLDAGNIQMGALTNYTIDQLSEYYSARVIKETKKEIDELQSVVAKLSKIPDREKYEKFKQDFKNKNPKAKRDDIRDAAKKAGLILPGGDIRSGDVKVYGEAKKNLAEFENKMKMLDGKVKKIFSNLENTKSGYGSEESKRIFLTESLSGDIMFGGSLASANSVITWDRNFKSLSTMSIPVAVREILPKFQLPKVATKSSGDWVTTVTKMSVDLAKIQKQVDTMSSDVASIEKQSQFPVEESFIQVIKENVGTVRRSKIEEMMIFLEYGKSLVQRYEKKVKHLKESLNEGRIDEVSFWEKIQFIFNSMVSAVKKIGQKVSQYFLEMKDSLYGSVSDIFDFFGLEIEVEPGYQVEVVF